MRRIKFVSLLICLCLLMSMAVSCSGSSKERTKRSDRDDEEEETEIETETETEETEPTEAPTEPTEEPTTVPTEEPTTEPPTEPPVTTPEIYIDKGFGTMRYSTYMSLCSELNDGNSDCLFGFAERYKDKPNEFDLLVYDPDSNELTTYFCDNSGELSVLETESIDEGEEYMIKELLTFDKLSKYPCMIDSRYSYGEEDFVSSLPDGYYFGRIVAVSNDGTRVLLSLGEGIVLSEEEYKDLKVGDKIKVDQYEGEYATITEVIETDDSYDIKFDLDFLWFSQGTFDDESAYILRSQSDIPVTINDSLIYLDLASDCEVKDFFGWLMYEGYEEGMEKMIEEEGYTNPLQTSSFWYYNYISEHKIESSNDWTPMYGLINAVIENGEIVKISIGWT